MAKPKSWSVKGVDDETRDLARAASQAAGLPIGTWIDDAIQRAARGELPGIAVSPAEGTTEIATAAEPASPPTPTSTPAPAPTVEPMPRTVDVGPAPAAPSQETDSEPLMAEASAGPAAGEAGARNVDVPPVEEPLVVHPEDRPGDVGVPDGETQRPAPFKPTPIPPRPQPLPILPAERRPGPLRYAAAGAVLLAILGGGIWIFSELSVPEQPVRPTQTAEPARDAKTPPAATTSAASTPTAPAPTAPSGVPENVRLGIEMAKTGDARAQHDLGMLYLAGRFVAKDPKEAAAWFEKAALQGLAAAQFNLGVLYQRGEGVRENAQLAVFWFQSAAEQNEPRAQHNLAAAYAEGRGVARSFEKAVEWFTKSANAGLVQSQYSLGRLYETGTPNHPPENEKARFWYEKAAAQGDADAADRLRALNALANVQKPIDRLDQEVRTPRPAASASSTPPSGKPAAEDRSLTRAEVRELQQLLRRLNFDPGPADGAIGKRTVEAIRLFQKFAGIESDGKPSVSLLEELRAVSKTMGTGG
jgi:TPR repeat protein